MRNPELALECLRLANNLDVDDARVVRRAESFYAFITEDAGGAKLAAVREAIR